MSETIIDPELGEIPVILETDSPEEKARKEKIIDDKVAAASANIDEEEK